MPSLKRRLRVLSFHVLRLEEREQDSVVVLGQVRAGLTVQFLHAVLNVGDAACERTFGFHVRSVPPALDLAVAILELRDRSLRVASVFQQGVHVSLCVTLELEDVPLEVYVSQERLDAKVQPDALPSIADVLFTHRSRKCSPWSSYVLRECATSWL